MKEITNTMEWESFFKTKGTHIVHTFYNEKGILLFDEENGKIEKIKVSENEGTKSVIGRLMKKVTKEAWDKIVAEKEKAEKNEAPESDSRHD